MLMRISYKALYPAKLYKLPNEDKLYKLPNEDNTT